MFKLSFDSRNVTISLAKVKTAFIFTIPTVVVTGAQCCWNKSGGNSGNLWPQFLWLSHYMSCILTSLRWEKQEESRKMLVSVAMVPVPRKMKNTDDGIDTL